MTRQEIIDALDVAKRMQGLMELLPEMLFEAHSQMNDAVSEILCDVIEADGAIDIILQALKAAAAADPAQLRELIEENGRLKLELNAAAEREAKMMVRIAELTPDPVEEEPDLEEEDDEPQSVEAKPEKKKRRSINYHKWTQTEDDWIAAHLNSVTNFQVAEKFGVSPKAAYIRMLAVKERLGK